MPLPNCTARRPTPTTRLIHLHWSQHTIQSHIRTHFTTFFATFFSNNYCQLIIIFHQHHHPSLLPLPPSTLLTTPTNFNFSISANQLRQLHFFHSIHGSVQFYLCDFHCYVSILSLTQLDLEKFTSCDFLFFFVLHCPFRLLHSIHVSVHFYISIYFPLLSLTQHGFEKFHPCYLVVFFFVLSEGMRE